MGNPKIMPGGQERKWPVLVGLRRMGPLAPLHSWSALGNSLYTRCLTAQDRDRGVCVMLATPGCLEPTLILHCV